MAAEDSAVQVDTDTTRRRRAKTTMELVSAFEALASERDALEAKLRARRHELESECYFALGHALFAQRSAEPTAGVYNTITASLGSRLKKKLDELSLLPEALD